MGEEFFHAFGVADETGDVEIEARALRNQVVEDFAGFGSVFGDVAPAAIVIVAVVEMDGFGAIGAGGVNVRPGGEEEIDGGDLARHYREVDGLVAAFVAAMEEFGMGGEEGLGFVEIAIAESAADGVAFGPGVEDLGEVVAEQVREFGAAAAFGGRDEGFLDDEA